MKKCLRCNLIFENNMSFCDKCGASLVNEADAYAYNNMSEPIKFENPLKRNIGVLHGLLFALYFLLL